MRGLMRRLGIGLLGLIFTVEAVISKWFNEMTCIVCEALAERD